MANAFVSIAARQACCVRVGMIFLIVEGTKPQPKDRYALEVLMTEAVEQLKSQAGSLSDPERAELACFLLTSLEPDEAGAEQAWRTEIARRVAEIRGGQAAGRPADEVLAELRERH